MMVCVGFLYSFRRMIFFFACWSSILGLLADHSGRGETVRERSFISVNCVRFILSLCMKIDALV